MLSIRPHSFRLADPTDRVFLVIARTEIGLKPNRYLVGRYERSRGDAAYGDLDAVLVTFADRRLAERMTRSVQLSLAGVGKFVCALPIREAAWTAFNRLHMDMVVVYDDAPTIFYAKRGSAFSRDLEMKWSMKMVVVICSPVHEL